MEIKVRAVDANEEKSSQEVEQELLNKHEEKFNRDNSEESNIEAEKVEIRANNDEPKVQEDNEIKPSELTEEEVLKFIGSRYGKEIKSLDELNQQRENEPLPEDVSTYLKYKKDTGRGFDDFAKLQKNYDEMDTEKLLIEYLTATEKGLDAEDITDLMEDYIYDEDLDDEKDIRKIKLAKKKTIAKAKEYFEQQQEKYRVPLESRRESNSETEDEDFMAYKQYIAEASTVEEQNSRKREVFTQKTDDVFSEFKGFEFTLDDNNVYFSPGDSSEIKNLQSDPTNFIKKFLDDDGIMKDARGYHRALAMAMHPDKFAKFFYEQGKSTAAEDTMKKLKNINMTTRNASEASTTKGGMQIKSVTNDHGRGLKIRSRK